MVPKVAIVFKSIRIEAPVVGVDSRDRALSARVVIELLEISKLTRPSCLVIAGTAVKLFWDKSMLVRPGKFVNVLALANVAIILLFKLNVLKALIADMSTTVVNLFESKVRVSRTLAKGVRAVIKLVMSVN